MDITTIRHDRRIKALVVTGAILVAALAVASGTPHAHQAGAVARLAQGTAGVCFAGIMAIMIALNGSTSGKATAERVPMHVFQATCALGMFAGALAVAHATIG